LGLEWIHHSQGEDIAAISFPYGLADKVETRSITEKYWKTTPTIEVGLKVKHLGFPEKHTARFADGTDGPIPVAMPGKITGYDGTINLETASAPGASGGPLILRDKDDTPKLIGIVTKATMFGNPYRIENVKPLNKTKAIPISLINDIFESDDMKKQIKRILK